MKKFDMKSIALGFLVGTVGITTVFAASGIKSAMFNSSKVYFYGKEVPLETQLLSIVKDGETSAQMYMPMRELLEYMNFIVEWNAKDSSVNLTMKGNNGDSSYPSYSGNTYGSGFHGDDQSKLSQSEADRVGIALMDTSGTWGPEIDLLIPQMTSAGVEKVVTIYLDRHLFPGITTPQGAKQVAATIDTALKHMTEDAKKAAEDKVSAYY